MQEFLQQENGGLGQTASRAARPLATGFFYSGI